MKNGIQQNKVTMCILKCLCAKISIPVDVSDIKLRKMNMFSRSTLG